MSATTTPSTLKAALPAAASSNQLQIDTKHLDELKKRLDDTNKKVTESFLKAMHTTVKDNFERMQSYEKDSSLLEKGCFYRADYSIALKTKGQMKRWTHMAEKGYFLHGYAPPTFMKTYSSADQKESAAATTTSVKPFSHSYGRFFPNNGISPSEALKGLQTGLVLTGCAEVYEMAFYQALLEILGDKFDALFGADSCAPFFIKCGREVSPISLLRCTVDIPKLQDLKPGHLIYIPSTDKYPHKHPLGSGRGMNLVCIEGGPHPKFIGFGLDPKGVTLLQVIEWLRADYNSKPLTPADLSTAAYTPQANAFEKDQISLEELLKTAKMPTTAQEIYFERIMLLAALPVEKGKELLKQWAHEFKYFLKQDAKRQVLAQQPVTSTIIGIINLAQKCFSCLSQAFSS